MTIYPPELSPRTLTRQVWSAETARTIPGVGRALDLIGGLAMQMSLDAYRGVMPLPRPRLLTQPDLDKDLPTFVDVQIADYLLHGNALHLVTVRDRSTGWPAACRWYPATAWHVYRDPDTGRRRYWLHGREVPLDDVVHVQNGADPLNECRGVGVVEKYVNALDRVALQDERLRSDTAQGNVPSVAITLPENDDSDEDELDLEAEKFEQKLDARNGGRRPAFFPHGTVVTPLAWSPNDAQAAVARSMSLTDVANMFGLDGWWLGAPNGSHNYKTPGPLFLVLVRTTLNRVLAPFEATWSRKWVPAGQRVRFNRDEIQGDDWPTTIAAAVQATGRPVVTVDEVRTTRLGLAPLGGDAAELAPGPSAPAPDPEPDPDDEPDVTETDDDTGTDTPEEA